MPSAADLLHVDLDAFYASVEQLRNPRLAGRPIIVGGGVVLSASYEARRSGVRSGMPTGKARRMCPAVVVVNGRFGDYGSISDEVFEVYRRFTPLVEQVSIDEAFLDVAGGHGLFGTSSDIAVAIRSAVLEETGLVVSVGAARTKFLAKVGSQVAKPDGVVLIEQDQELGFLHRLPTRYLWGAGPVMQGKLAALGLTTIGQVAQTPVQVLAARLGRGVARHLHDLAWNRDPGALDMGRRALSVGSQRTFGRDVKDMATYHRVLANLADRVGARLRARNRVGRTITVTVRFADFQSITRSTTLRAPVATNSALFDVGCELLRRGLTVAEGRGVRLLGISVSGIQVEGHLQLELPLPDDSRGVRRAGSPQDRLRTELDANVDRLREKYGKDVIGNASVLLGPDGGRDGLSELITRRR